MTITRVRQSTLDLTLGNIVINVLTLDGVLGDGVTDVSALVNTAIAAVGAAGATFYFPQGTYLFSTASLTLKSNISVTGDGPALSTVKNTSYIAFAGALVDTGANVNNIAISGVKFQFTGAASVISPTNQNIIKSGCLTNFSVRNCEFTSSSFVNAAISCEGWYSPISGAPAQSDVNIIGNKFTNTGYGVILGNATRARISDNTMIVAGANSAYSIYCNLCSSSVIRANIVQGAIVLDDCSSFFVTDNNVTGVTSSSGDAIGCFAAQPDSSTPDNIVVMNNLFNNGTNASVVNRVVGLDSISNISFVGNTVLGGLQSMDISSCDNLIVNDNIFTGVAGTMSGIVASTLPVGKCSIKIQNNVISGVKQNAIYLGAATAGSTVHVTYNSFYNLNTIDGSTADTNAAISLSTGATGYNITGNSYRGHGTYHPTYLIYGTSLAATSIVAHNMIGTFYKTAALSIAAATAVSNI